MWERVTLFFRGLKQLFEQGGFSGAVREELNRAENQGLKRFLISIYQIAYRIGQIWQGFKDGFTSTIEEARPVFEDLVEALSDPDPRVRREAAWALALIGPAAKEAAFQQVMNYFRQNREDMKRVIETEVDVSVEKDNLSLIHI